MKKVVFFLLILFTHAGCKKYPDGPLISLRTKEHRLTGEWDVEYFSINGYDSTAYLKSKPFYGKYVFSKQEDSHGRKFFAVEPTSVTHAYGSWEFTNRKEDVKISCDQTNCDTLSYTTVGAYGRLNITWEIRRLKDKELWLKTTYNGKEYFVKFKH